MSEVVEPNDAVEDNNDEEIYVTEPKNNEELLEGLSADPELDGERKKLWKNFGRESDAGKLLFSLYKCH